ncbi:MAG: hypothetical protein FWJ73_00325 [Limnochordales bacterium]|nr:hypothetical protein [Bacillota bacterium]
MKWKRLGKDYVYFVLLILPLPFIGMLDVSTTVRLLLLAPIIVLQALFIHSALRRDREGR